MRALAKDSDGLEGSSSAAQAKDDQPTGLLASLSRRLKSRRAQKSGGGQPPSEDALRRRVEEAVARSRRASWLADRLAALRHEIDDELVALTSTRRRAHDEADLARGRVIDEAVRAAHDDDAKTRQAQAGRHAQALETLEQRLEALCAQARAIIDIVDTLYGDVAAFAQTAARHTDTLAARASAAGIADDAAAVLAALDAALHALGGGLDEAAAFARAVHERIAGTSSADPSFQASLHTLVQGALARRAAQDAKEKAAR